MSFAALDHNLCLVALETGSLEEVLSSVFQHPAAFVAVDAPQSPNAGLMAGTEWRDRFGLSPTTRTWARFKVCEYELRRRGILLYNTPAERAEAPRWMQTGFLLYERLHAGGFVTYRRAAERSSRQVLEVHPHGCYTALLGRLPFKKDTLEGRLQRQLLLYREGLDVPDAMRVFEEITRHHLLSGQLDLGVLYTHDQLDALVAAYTAYLAALLPNRITLVGDPEEGQIVVPVAELKDWYGEAKIQNPKSQ